MWSHDYWSRCAHTHYSTAIAFTDSGLTLASGSFLNAIHVWDVAFKQTGHTRAEQHVRPPQNIMFLNDSLQVKSCRNNLDVKV
jgi:WD40 repeat protein